MLKLLGAVLILLAGTGFGFYQARQLANRPRQIRQLIQALQRMETEIAYGFTFLPEAMIKVSKQLSSPLSHLFQQIGQQLSASSGQSTKDVWQTSVKEGWKHTSMKEAEKEILLQLGYTLGLTDKEDQVKHLRLGVSQLQAEEEQARDEQRRYEKMWKSLGLLAGALIVILIY
jgi:stage III sporulation protein AB